MAFIRSLSTNLWRYPKLKIGIQQAVSVRHGSYITSPPVGDASQYTYYEVFSSPGEWKYVERLFPLSAIPLPTLKNSYPSGWTPPTAKSNQYPYYVHRSKSHMMPVYLEISKRGMRRITTIKKVDGDIWALSEEVSKYLSDLNTTKIMAIQVNEVLGHILIHGDHVNKVKQFLLDKGF